MMRIACLLILLVSVDAYGEKKIFWGDTHLHTKYSLDAYAFGNHAIDPDSAFKFAKGTPVLHPRMQHRVHIGRPLDFLVVSDHAEYAGTIQKLFTADPSITDGLHGSRLAQLAQDPENAKRVLFDLVGSINSGVAYPDLVREKIRLDAWKLSVDAADRHNEPGIFTAFIGWEWSSTTDGANLHRVIVTSAGADKALEFTPFSSLDSDDPEDLWDWLDRTSARTAADFVSIPHNSNLSKGKMFQAVDSNGSAFTADYVQQRLKWEPITEITQVKGDSETHPELSPDDPFAHFEPYENALDTREGVVTRVNATGADYIRSALKQGLAQAQRIDANPYQFGLIGSSDMHTGLVQIEEDDMGGKYFFDSISVDKNKPGLPGATGWTYSASGLAAISAEENTRSALLAAMKRREVYATTGPRINLKFTATAAGREVVMGGEITNNKTAPELSVYAMKDAIGANLDRIQIIKGWVDRDGQTHEKVFNVAWSGDRTIDEAGNISAVGDSVDRATGRTANTIGAPELHTTWTDPTWKSDEHAFYYVRVLQIPTARHSLYDALALGLDITTTGYPSTLQERAYSSPIWFTPSKTP